MVQISLQEAYNILSIIGFFICMYKLYKLENALKHVTTNQILSSVTTMIVIKKLEDKGLIDGLDIKIEQNEQQS
jgi:hypothetical protein